MKTKQEIKKYFENGDKPTQEQFWEWQDSYWHKDEKLENTIPLSGTEAGKSVTGNIEFAYNSRNPKKLYSVNGNQGSELFVGAGSSSFASYNHDTHQASNISINYANTVLSSALSDNSSRMDVDVRNNKVSISKGANGTTQNEFIFDATGFQYNRFVEFQPVNALKFENGIGLETSLKIKADFSSVSPYDTDELTINQYSGFKYEQGEKQGVLNAGVMTVQNHTDLIMANVDDGLYANKYYAPATPNYYVQQKYVDEKIGGHEEMLDLSGSGLTGSIRLEKHGKFAFAKIAISGTLEVGASTSVGYANVLGNSHKLITYTDGSSIRYVSISTSNAGIQFSNPVGLPITFNIGDCFIFDLAPNMEAD